MKLKFEIIGVAFNDDGDLKLTFKILFWKLYLEITRTGLESLLEESDQARYR